ncbi:tyrosine--tRNA ligase, mitochondrial [Trichonephila clavata]|uniref:Tyrosine--tRNA ligase n=1 Tax=Trichonephila clavata TaxID=2740835 RepID=A0A8X6M7A0_TRICU|nr:tyrosine--tRNA ligase, mitochondrial [Trichonephila clavata]
MACRMGKACWNFLNVKPQIHLCCKVRNSSSDVLYRLLRRGLVKQIFPNDQSITCSGTPCAYAGFDATADSLHVGNLLVLVSLIHWQRAGYETIAVVGDATAKIGDPSGHKSDRKLLSYDVVSQNAESIEKNLFEIFQNHEKDIFPKSKTKGKLGKLRILKNSHWYENTSIVDFISEAGRHIRVSDMLSRTSVKNRMESGVGINFSEFSYQIFQSYDWLHLFRTYNCRFQFGGNDQLGNITSGYNLVSGLLYQPVYGALLPLVQSETGDKFGKTAGNAVFLDQNRTSPFDFYQFFMRLPDADVGYYLKLFTFLNVEEIEDILHKHLKNPDLRKAQKKLSEEVTLLVHGDQGLDLAETATKILFHSDIESLAKLNMQNMNQVFPLSATSQILFEPGMSLLDLTMKAGCFLKKEDADRIIRGGGVYLNFERITSPQFVIIPDQYILPNGVSLIRIGKKTYYLVIWK